MRRLQVCFRTQISIFFTDDRWCFYRSKCGSFTWIDQWRYQHFINHLYWTSWRMVVTFFMNRETVISQPTQSSATDQRQLHKSFPLTASFPSFKYWQTDWFSTKSYRDRDRFKWLSIWSWGLNSHYDNRI